MAIKINNLRIDLNEDPSSLKGLASKKLKVKSKDIIGFKILKESVDARHKGKIDFIYTVELSLDGDEASVVKRFNDPDITYIEQEVMPQVEHGTIKLCHRPIIAGSGPAGLFAGLLLAKHGYKPILLERGRRVDERTRAVKEFWGTGNLDYECNVQFGEGGAGTFSDGKLTTRIRDIRCSMVLNELVDAGAPGEITYNYRPHIGTDILKTVVANIREEIIRYGGEVRFSSKLTNIKNDGGNLSKVTVNNEIDMDCSALVLAIGHSARDTLTMLHRAGLAMTPKPFAVGFRIEHKQSMIDESQYGKFAEHPRLKAADYRLTYRSEKYDRPCYTFCMCPGGLVVAAASEEKMLVTNGMSEYKRDKENANSALVCGVTLEDFQGSSPLSGMEFQRRLEESAFNLGGGDYIAPVQKVEDFIKSKTAGSLGNVKPSYTRGYSFADLNKALTPEICAVIKEGLLSFDRKIKGFGSGDAVLTGVETRTSSPVRMERREDCQSVSISGVYPAGEGAGYAGGIISAAVDGIRVAEEIMKKYAPL